MKHVICLIHRDHLTIERNGMAIGNVYELYGQPTIQLNNAPNGQVIQLTRTDCDIIWDNWNYLTSERVGREAESARTKELAKER